MKQKSKANAVILAFTLIFTMTLFAGCNNTTPKPSPSTTPPQSPVGVETMQPTASPSQSPGKTDEDVKTTASIVNTPEAFEKAVSKDGTWIICLIDDLTLTKEVTLEGEFTNGKKDEQGKDVIQRKIALYTQDENRNITERFTLTVPKLTIKSPNASIQHGTVKGDLYVDVDNFQLVDATVEGNVYFTNASHKSTFKMDDKSKITGKQEVKQ